MYWHAKKGFFENRIFSDRNTFEFWSGQLNVSMARPAFSAKRIYHFYKQPDTSSIIDVLSQALISLLPKKTFQAQVFVLIIYCCFYS